MSNRCLLSFWLVFAAIAVLCVSSTRADIIGPYTVDANTLHLWHLEDTALPILDSPTVATPISLTSIGVGDPGTQLGITSYTPPTFGKAFKNVNAVNNGIYAKAPVNGGGDNTPMASFMGADGAFTYEAMMRVDFDPETAVDLFSAQVMSADNESTGGGGRTFQWTFDKTSGTWNSTFTTISPAVETVTSSNFALAKDHWYHAALTYNGLENTTDNIKIYWTDMGTDALPNGSAAIAMLVGSGKITNDMPSTNSSDFCIGAEARASVNSGQFDGLIDEVRISDIARGPDQFIFVPEPSTILMLVMAGLGLVAYARRRR